MVAFLTAAVNTILLSTRSPNSPFLLLFRPIPRHHQALSQLPFQCLSTPHSSSKFSAIILAYPPCHKLSHCLYPASSLSLFCLPPFSTEVKSYKNAIVLTLHLSAHEHLINVRQYSKYVTYISAASLVQ